MAPLPNVPNVLRIQLKHTVGGDHDALVRWFAQYTGTAPTDAQLTTLATYHLNTAWSAIRGSVAAQTQLDTITITDLTSPTSGVGFYSNPSNGTGDASTTAAGLAVVISGKIARRYRGGHPRVYLPYLTGANLTNPQTWNATQLATLLAEWNTMVNDVLSQTWAAGSLVSAVNVSYFEGFTNFTFPSGRVKAIPKLRVGGPVTDAILSWAANPAPASQRRRNLTL